MISHVSKSVQYSVDIDIIAITEHQQLVLGFFHYLSAVIRSSNSIIQPYPIQIIHYSVLSAKYLRLLSVLIHHLFTTYSHLLCRLKA